jgi:membrane protease YdiL (CAAX protease family)
VGGMAAGIFGAEFSASETAVVAGSCEYSLYRSQPRSTFMPVAQAPLSPGYMVTVLFIVYGLVATLLGLLLGGDVRLAMQAIIGVSIMAPMFAGWLWMEARDRGLSAQTVMGRFPRPVELLSAIVLGLALIGVALAMIWLAVGLGHAHSEKWGALLFMAGAIPETLSGWALVMQLAAFVVLVPICEEWAFRGVMLRSWIQRSGVNRGVFWSAFWFAFIHGISLPIAFLYGWVIGRFYLATRSLVCCIAAHMTINIAALAAAFADYSPRLDGAGLGPYLERGPVLLACGGVGAVVVILLDWHHARRRKHLPGLPLVAANP